MDQASEKFLWPSKFLCLMSFENYLQSSFVRISTVSLKTYQIATLLSEL